MTLTPEREAELIEKNLHKCYRAADNFIAGPRNSLVGFDYEDLVQQCVIAFLKYIRRCKTEEDLEKFPWFDAKHAMCMQVLNSQSFSVPKRTNNFRKVINSIPQTCSYEVAVIMGEEIDSDDDFWQDDVHFMVDFEDFMSDKDVATNRIAAMKRYGLSNRKIGAQFGISDVAISRRMNRLHQKYNEYNEEDE